MGNGFFFQSFPTPISLRGTPVGAAAILTKLGGTRGPLRPAKGPALVGVRPK